MPHPAQTALLEKLVLRLDGAPPAEETGEVPTEHYVCPLHFDREQNSLFARVPQICALESEFVEAGSCLSVELAGVALILVRGQDGVLRGFKNACRHRSTRLLSSDVPCTKKALVCPYHGWTYDLSGRLIHVPHAESFAGREAERSSLVEVPVLARYGFVWAALEPFDADSLLEPIAGELVELGADRGSLYRRSTREVAGNWKLVIDAFLDAYHIRHLHRDTIYRFFFDAQSEAERAGSHIRALTARRALAEARNDLGSVCDLRQLATPSYLLFPNTILIVHPDYLSVIVAQPIAPGRTRFVHAMLIPELPRTPAQELHWSKSFELIDEGVFLREDLFVVEAMQRGLETGANKTQLFGSHENAALWFHQGLARALLG